MSNKYLDDYTVVANSPFSDSVIAGDTFVMDMFRFATKEAISAFQSYWHSEDAQKIVKEDTFGFIWNEFPDQRQNLLNLAINKATDSGSSRIKSLSKEFCSAFVRDVYEDIPTDYQADTNALRARLACVLEPNFDYLSELTKFSLTEEYEDLYSTWERAALSCSRDPNVYDFLWSKVKREAGATDRKQNILKRAICNDALSDDLIKRISKSSPKRLKREVVRGLAEDIGNHNRRLRRYELNGETHMVLHSKEKLDTLESRAMLFVGCDDYQVVESLIDCLSRDNLPWLMPSASGHYWLSRRLSGLLDEKQQ